MTFPAVLLPLVVALALALSVTTAHRRLPPALAARVVSATVVVLAAAAVPTLWILSLAFLVHLPVVGTGFGWCAEAIGVRHAHIPTWVGLKSVVESADRVDAKAWNIVETLEGDGAVRIFPIHVSGAGQAYYRVRFVP